MDLKNKTIDENKNKCKVCSKELCLGDIITKESLLCHGCYDIISNIEVNDIQYEFYKENVKKWLLRKYNLII